jgi:tetrahydromethanopterin S-methyltransferase subunit C
MMLIMIYEQTMSVIVNSAAIVLLGLSVLFPKPGEFTTCIGCKWLMAVTWLAAIAYV